MRPVHLTFSGMNNKAQDTALPEGKLRNAVNVNFDNSNQILFPRWGDILRYSGDVHSIYKTPFISLFVESGTLKKLNDDYSATTLKTGVGDEKLSYTVVGKTVYFSNKLVNGRVVDGQYKPWSPVSPPRQPDVNYSPAGGMFAGDYLVAITWLSDSESATGMATRVTVPEGGGIHLTNFPTPPSEVTQVNVYVSSVNGEELYLYDRYPSYITTLTLSKNIGTIPLETQFLMPVPPSEIIQAHYGRIYYTYGNELHRTALRRYGLHKSGEYNVFDSNIQIIVSMTNVLYIGTENFLYRVDTVGEIPVKTTLQECGSVKGSVCYHPDGSKAYFMSDRGIIEATNEGLNELTFNDVAMPFFGKGCTTYLEKDGLEYLVFTGQDPVANPLVNSSYAASEALRGTL